VLFEVRETYDGRLPDKTKGPRIRGPFVLLVAAKIFAIGTP
jgi:hypothetical protein